MLAEPLDAVVGAVRHHDAIRRVDRDIVRRGHGRWPPEYQVEIAFGGVPKDTVIDGVGHHDTSCAVKRNASRTVQRARTRAGETELPLEAAVLVEDDDTVAVQ